MIPNIYSLLCCLPDIYNYNYIIVSQKHFNTDIKKWFLSHLTSGGPKVGIFFLPPRSPKVISLLQFLGLFFIFSLYFEKHVENIIIVNIVTFFIFVVFVVFIFLMSTFVSAK